MYTDDDGYDDIGDDEDDVTVDDDDADNDWCAIRIADIYEFCFLPGLFFLLPCVDTFRSVDLRTFSYDIPPQEVSTRLNSKYNITKLLLVIK